MSSIPQSREEGKLSAPRHLQALPGGKIAAEINDPIADLKNAESREDAKEIMEALARNKTISKNEKGFYEPENHPSVVLYRQVLTHFRKQEKADLKSAQAHETRKDVKQVVEKSKHETKTEASDKVAQAKHSFAKAHNPKEVVSLAKSLVGTLLDYNDSKKIVAIHGDSESQVVFKAFNEAFKRFEAPGQSQKAPQVKAHEAKPTFVTAKPETKEKSNEKITEIKRSFAQAKNYDEIFKIANPLVGTLLGHDQNKKMAALQRNAQSAEVFKTFNEALERMRKKPKDQKKVIQQKTEKPVAPKAKHAEPKPIPQNTPKAKAIKDMNENEVADLIVEAAVGISPNKETEKLNANPKLKTLRRALSAFANNKPDLLLPGLTMERLENVLREATDLQDPELEIPRSLYDFEIYHFNNSDFEDAALKLNKLIEKAKASKQKKT